MIVFRENPRVEGKWRRDAAVLNIVETSLPLHGKEHKFCHSLAFMVLGRVNPALHTYEEVVEDNWSKVTFCEILKAPAIEGATWSNADNTICSLVSAAGESFSGIVPLDLCFRLRPRDSIELTIRDARVIDRKTACRRVATLLLHPRLVARFRYIQKDVMGIIARMVWTTRLDALWTVDPLSSKRTKVVSSARYRDWDMPEEERRDIFFRSNDGDDDDEDEDEDGGSFSLQSENSEEDEEDEEESD
jgi:hypothetical protein